MGQNTILKDFSIYWAGRQKNLTELNPWSIFLAVTKIFKICNFSYLFCLMTYNPLHLYHPITQITNIFDKFLGLYHKLCGWGGAVDPPPLLFWVVPPPSPGTVDCSCSCWLGLGNVQKSKKKDSLNILKFSEKKSFYLTWIFCFIIC